ncbi:MAG: translation initiation factor IF-3 [Deltaproteobacteria bacterium]|nr:translation initiation factor IF-3 [Deltaproteobacteria bacterium]
MNRQIRAREVMVIGAEGEKIGVLKTEEAMKLALDAGLDLVEVGPNTVPPVCRIMDFGKFKYQKKKRKQEAKKKQSVTVLKEVKLRPKTNEHDLQTKIRHINRFLEEDSKVKVTMVFRGREISFSHLGARILEKIKEETVESGIVERDPKFEGKAMIMILAPKKK